ncbi:MAG: adenylate/guanylate cyclase domain-containing protein, partial [Anaerolineaceae bacterium]|nr:adenylate/guanylate cyclase domain-containing protein [Anaerolineaceae bacterium]
MSERERIEQAIVAMEAQRGALGDKVVDTTLFVFREKLAGFEKESSPEEYESREPNMHRFVTILFAEISGLNEIAETVNLEEVHEIANQLWRRLDAILIRFEGLIQRHAGGTVMAIFGTANEGAHAEHAVRAALDIASETKRFCDEGSIGNIQVRTGLHSGFMKVTQIGQNQDYTTFGETVNLARILQFAAPTGEVWISHSTYREVRGIFETQTLNPLRINAKEDSIQVYVVRGIRPRVFLASQAAGWKAQMVGREKELSFLLRQYEKTIANRTVVAVGLKGEIGVGKTRLMNEFIRRLGVEGK